MQFMTHSYNTATSVRCEVWWPILCWAPLSCNECRQLCSKMWLHLLLERSIVIRATDCSRLYDNPDGRMQLHSDEQLLFISFHECCMSPCCSSTEATEPGCCNMLPSVKSRDLRFLVNTYHPGASLMNESNVVQGLKCKIGVRELYVVWGPYH